MAMDLTWILSAKDNASSVFDKVKQAGSGAASGIEGAFSGVLGKFNLLTGAVGTLAGIAAGGIFAKIVSETVNYDLAVGKLASTLGMTTEQASIYSVALQRAGIDQGVAESAGLRLAKTLSSNEEVFKKLGVATRDSNGNLRSTADLMPEVNQKLSEMKAGTDRNVIAMEIYGRSWNDVRQLLKLTPEAMEEARRKAEQLHLIVGDEGVRQGKKYKENLNDLGLVAKSLSLQFGNVLLPWLVKVGSFLGENGPILAQAFQWSLNALGFTVTTLGEWLGLMAYRGVTAFNIIKAGLTFDFAGVKQEWNNFVSAGEDFNKRVKDRWSQDWTKGNPVTSKPVKGNQLPVDTAVSEKQVTETAEENLKKRLQLWKDNAKKILDTEKDRISALISAEKDYLSRLKANYDERVSLLDKFRTSYNSVLDSIAARDKALADERDAQAYANEDSYSRYYRQRAELATAEQRTDSDPAFTPDSIAKKLKSYDDQITKAKQLRDDVLAGKVDIVSKEQAEQDFLITKQHLEEKIKLIGDDQIKTQTSAAEKAAEAVGLMEKGLKVQENQLKIIEGMLKNIPDITEKELRIKVTGLSDLYNIQALTKGANSTTSIQSFGDYYVQNGKTYWNDGTLAEDGTSVALPQASTGTNRITKGGLVRVHDDEAIVPAQFNAGYQPQATASSDTYHFHGDMILPNVTNQSTAREFFAEFQKLARRQASA